jgi:hypothetical protein
MRQLACSWTGIGFLAGAVFLSSGCGPAGPKKISIRGTVTLDGQQLPEGQVVFIPTDPALGAAGGAIVNGVFTLSTYKGPHRVEVNSQKTKAQAVPDGGLPESGLTFVDIIPSRYNEKTTLSFDVQSSQDRPEFNLTSDR